MQFPIYRGGVFKGLEEVEVGAGAVGNMEAMDRPLCVLLFVGSAKDWGCVEWACCY